MRVHVKVANLFHGNTDFEKAFLRAYKRAVPFRFSNNNYFSPSYASAEEIISRKVKLFYK